MGIEKEIFDKLGLVRAQNSKLQLSLGSKNWAFSTFGNIHRVLPSCRHLPFFYRNVLNLTSTEGRSEIVFLTSKCSQNESMFCRTRVASVEHVASLTFETLKLKKF